MKCLEQANQSTGREMSDCGGLGREGSSESYGVCFWSDDDVLQLDRGDGCRTS